jgi:hypothetical protein
VIVNDCGKWINNVDDGARYDGTFYDPAGRDAPMFAGVGSCDGWDVILRSRCFFVRSLTNEFFWEFISIGL